MKNLKNFENFYKKNSLNEEYTPVKNDEEQLKVSISNTLRIMGYHLLSDKAFDMIDEFASKLMREIRK